jgi:adenosylhomocysteinase
MDLSFATQALCVEELVRAGASLEHRVLPTPPGIDVEIARLKLAALGVQIDELTDEQRAYLSAWDPESG